MKIIGPIGNLFAEVFKNPTSMSIVEQFNSNEVRCWSLITKEEQSDNHIYEKLYGNKSRQAYNQFKAGFLRKIVSIVINHESDALSTTQAIHHEVYRGYCAVLVLFSIGKIQVAIPLAEKLVKKCKKYNINSIGRDLATKLATHYLMREHDPRKAKEFKNLSFLLHERVGIEMEADYLRTKIMGSHNPLAHSALASIYAETLSKYEHIESHRFKLIFYYMKMIANGDDKRGIIEVATKALDYFTNLHYDHSVAKNMFRRWLMNTHLQLGDLDFAASYLNASLDELKPGVQRDMMLLNKTQIFLFTDAYPKALETLREIHHSARFRFSNKTFKADYWELKLYIHLIERLGFLPASEVSIRKIKHNLSRNVGETMKQSIALFILGILDSGVDYAIEHEADLDHWIRKDVSVRTKLFLKHLKKLANSKYERMDMSYLDKLREEKLELDFSVHMDEVIPYEELWTMLSEKLAQKQGIRMGGR